MPQAIRISINDGKSTPVVHHFDPSNTEGSSATMANAVSQTLVGREKLVVTVRSATSQAPGKVAIRLTLPTETLQADGTYKVTQFSTGIIELLVPAESSAAQRKDLRVLMLNALQNATLIDVIENVNPLY